MRVTAVAFLVLLSAAVSGANRPLRAGGSSPGLDGHHLLAAETLPALSQDVLARLQSLTDQGDSAALQTEIFDLLKQAANSVKNPTSAAIDQFVARLLREGPQDALFAGAVGKAADYFNRGQVEEAAAAIKAAFEAEPGPKGAIAASRLLSRYAKQFDPLTAGRLLKAAQPTISKMIRLQKR